ncbi:16S rRNA (adenine(1518)-N(6)/adenine(1519)-N(6))-dimethyltransferase RsmA [Balneolales bacterium ANBcel1]|nr:16S rRNA (adenine(1518)-N(6)/adenine(1519)-N(6))-dimethyltransferase RsmA [Balneolales bacterium ANBcel1]
MNIRPKKSLGQHFLRDRQVAEKIVSAVRPGDTDRVVEIGPGTGALTGMLLERFPDMTAYEVDERSITVLRQKYPGLTVHAQSFLDAQPESMAAGVEGKPFLVGNLPYYLTSPILFRVIDNGDLFSGAVLMIQKEVAERLVARPRTRDYGILSVQAQVLGQIELLFPVSRHVFHPPPKVESAVIFYRPGNERYPGSVRDLPVSLGRFKLVVRTAFQQRRKKLSNALKPLFGNTFPEGFDAGRRAEELEPEVFVKLAEWLDRQEGGVPSQEVSK